MPAVGGQWLISHLIAALIIAALIIAALTPN
jgi:hypothetical protein